MAKTVTTALFAILSLASQAAIPVRWTADAYKVKPLVYDCYHGETLDLAATLTAYGEPLDFAGRTARLYWQTNGMDAAWWSTNATVRVDSEAGATNVLAAIWSGAYDTGADAVTGFIGVEGENYRAAFTLRFRPSPGFTPNRLNPPVTVLDFAAVSVLNPESSPFVVKGGESGVTLAQVTNVAQNVTSNIVPAWARSETPPESMTDNAVVLTNSILRTKGGAEISASNVGDAATTNQLNDVKAIVTTWENFLDGSNVVFSITNYIGGSYSLDTAKLRILEMTNGVYHEIYNSRDEIALHMTDFKTNEFVAATNEIVTAVDAKVADKAPKAWGTYSSGGTELSTVGISDTVYMTAPRTVFAGGLEYERVVVGSGVVGVLTTKGAQAYTQGEPGKFIFNDETTTNYFGWTKGDSYIVGCDSIISNKVVSGNTLISLYYSLIASSYPVILYKPTLTNEWEQLNYSDGTAIPGASVPVEWATGVESFIANINCGSNLSGFFTAQIVSSGDATFETNMKAKLDGGILCTDNASAVKAVKSGSQIYWQTTDGAATSRIQLGTYDFQSGTNFTLNLYQTLTNIIDRLGGSVTNAPSFD